MIRADYLQDDTNSVKDVFGEAQAVANGVLFLDKLPGKAKTVVKAVSHVMDALSDVSSRQYTGCTV